MEIDSLEMISFRNHDNTKIAFDPNLTVLWGKNGSGKTSILEAIHTLSLGKSFRTNNKKEMVKNGKDMFLLKGFFKNNRGNKNAVFYSQDRRGNQITKVNNKTITKRKDLLGLNNVVVFSPEEERITKGPPGERRRFFNKVFSICSGAYLENLLLYNKIIKQRNAVLKNSQKTQNKIEQLDAWDEPLANAGQKLWNERKVLIEEFARVFNYITKELDEKLKAAIQYKEKKKDRKEFIKITKKNNRLDIKNGFTSFGPHKDDVIFLWNKNAVRKHGSQGEHKLFLALLKVSELLFLSKKTEKNPVFLIDDLFASLDIEKSKKLLDLIRGLCPKEDKKQQTIITTTDLAGLEKNGVFLGFKKIKTHHICKNGNT